MKCQKERYSDGATTSNTNLKYEAFMVGVFKFSTDLREYGLLGHTDIVLFILIDLFGFALVNSFVFVLVSLFVFVISSSFSLFCLRNQ